VPKIGKSESFTYTFIKIYDDAYSKILYEASELSSPQAYIKAAFNYTPTGFVTFRVSILAQHVQTFHIPAVQNTAGTCFLECSQDV
jgi:hypothetical protein